tara:strand:- start:210 stop:422 length:213 start_codon:yes stop_codon:yes gene_type:complete
LRSIETLVEVYNNFGDKENLSPLSSADEELIGNPKLTEKQKTWLKRFINIWELTEEKEQDQWQKKIGKKK